MLVLYLEYSMLLGGGANQAQGEHYVSSLWPEIHSVEGKMTHKGCVAAIRNYCQLDTDIDEDQEAKTRTVH